MMALSNVGIGLAVFFGAVVSVHTQDSTPCEEYDVDSGKGTCNGIAINIGAVICGEGFDESKCKASMPYANGGSEIYYFKVFSLPAY